VDGRPCSPLERQLIALVPPLRSSAFNPGFFLGGNVGNALSCATVFGGAMAACILARSWAFHSSIADFFGPLF
jgi:hypothetical protein